MMGKEKQNTTSRLEATYKSADTEEWLDIHFTRPVGLWWAGWFERWGVHPNTVTMLSIFLGIAAGLNFYYRDLWHNLLGMLLLMWANFYDSADGQLARMTGKKTRWGRILDGFAGDVWFYTYVCICLRLMPQFIPGTSYTWSWIIWVVAAFSGLVCHAKQCALADYYRNIHLYFLKGREGSELDSYHGQRELLHATPRKGNFWWRLFLWGYGNYTYGQEQMTPAFQQLMRYLHEQKGQGEDDAFRADFRKCSLPLMKYTNILTFNTRAIVLYVSCLIDEPWIYFVAELTVFTVLAVYMRWRHECMCRRFLRRLQAGVYH
jgi:hypothetical protein